MTMQRHHEFYLIARMSWSPRPKNALRFIRTVWQLPRKSEIRTSHPLGWVRALVRNLVVPTITSIILAPPVAQPLQRGSLPADARESTDQKKPTIYFQSPAGRTSSTPDLSSRQESHLRTFGKTNDGRQEELRHNVFRRELIFLLTVENAAA